MPPVVRSPEAGGSKISRVAWAINKFNTHLEYKVKNEINKKCGNSKTKQSKNNLKLL